MKRIIIFVLLFAAIKVAGQTTGYLRFDTVKIMKQNGTAELYIINKTKDSLGLLTNIGGGLTRFIKSTVLNDSTLVIGLDTLKIGSGGGGTTLINASGAGDTLLTADGKIKRIDHDATLIGSTNANKLLLGVDTSSYISTISKLRDTAAAIRAAIGSGGAGTASDGIRKNISNFELGDISTTTTSTFTADRFLRSGNRSIYLQGDKTDNGNPNFVFDDTLAAAPGDPRFKNWLRINSLDHVTPGFYLGTASVDDGTATSRNNHIMNWGFNLGPNSTRVNPNYCAIGISWEGAFQALQEMHKFWVDKYNIQHRIESYTIDTAAKSVDLFHQISAWELKDVDGGAETWVDFTGGQGGTSTNFRLYAGSTNQYRIQHGFSVAGGNTTASISTTGPGSTEFHMGVPEGWGTVSLPGLTSLSTYNSVSQQLLPSGDGTIIFGDPTARWQKVSSLYLRASNGLFIGDYSGDELPNGLIDFGTNRSLVSYASGSADDAVMFVNNGLGASFGVRNLNAAGYAGIEYIGDDGAVKVFTGFNNSNGQEFRFNNIATGGYIRFLAGGAERFKINNTGGPTINGAYTLPGVDGTNGQVLTTNGSGAASWGTATGGGIYGGSGSLTTNTTVSGASNSLTLGASGDKLSALTTNVTGTSTYNSNAHTFNDAAGHSFGISSAGFFSINGSLNVKIERATDANTSVTTSSCTFILPDITANRTLSLPATAREGMIYIIINTNTTGNTWQFGGGGSLVNQDGSAVTSFANNTTYIIMGDNTANVYRILK